MESIEFISRYKSNPDEISEVVKPELIQIFDDFSPIDPS